MFVFGGFIGLVGTQNIFVTSNLLIRNYLDLQIFHKKFFFGGGPEISIRASYLNGAIDLFQMVLAKFELTYLPLIPCFQVKVIS